MIFITLGSQKFQFNRLLQAVDELIDKGVIKEEVFAQITSQGIMNIKSSLIEMSLQLKKVNVRF